jgi:hypothetical protein
MGQRNINLSVFAPDFCIFQEFWGVFKWWMLFLSPAGAKNKVSVPHCPLSQEQQKAATLHAAFPLIFEISLLTNPPKINKISIS